MPKGRGANARRSKYQKDNQDKLDAGANKLLRLYEKRARVARKGTKGK